ncbi:hypothetical protein D3C85_858900 [compost metagenome]
MIEEDLGARAARTGIAHGPEVVGGIGRTLVVADADHPLGRHADFLVPDLVGFVVVGVDGDPELVLRQFQPVVAGEEFPGEVDGIALEVIAETEVAQHLEEGVVTRGVTDVLQVVVLAAGAHALLAGGRTGVGALFQAEEAVLELVHPGVGEQQRRVVARNQGTGSDTGVPLLFEEAEESFTDFSAFHRIIHGNRRPRQSRQRAALYRPFSIGTACLSIDSGYNAARRGK